MTGTALLSPLLSIRVHSSSEFDLLGRRHSGTELAEALYGSLHCLVPTSGSPDSGFTNWTGARDFVDRLSAANCGSGTWQSGWTARGVEADGRIVAERHGVSFWVPPGEYRPGAARIPKEHFDLIPGFYLAHGDADDTRDAGDTIRIYWHISPLGAERLMELVTGRLNQAGIGFQLKLLGEPLRYHRTDPAVLYLARADYPRAAPVLGEILREMTPRLRSTVSLLVKEMAQGVGLAEDPGDGSSFGEHRCRLLAGIVSEPDWGGLGSDAERAALLTSRLTAQGYDLDRLYLNPGSADDFLPLGGDDR
jgi:hypothetical protein